MISKFLNDFCLNAFVPNAPFFYPLKTSENVTVLWCFQGADKVCIGNKCVTVLVSKFQTSKCDLCGSIFDEIIKLKVHLAMVFTVEIMSPIQRRIFKVFTLNCSSTVLSWSKMQESRFFKARTELRYAVLLDKCNSCYNRGELLRRSLAWPDLSQFSSFLASVGS